MLKRVNRLFGAAARQIGRLASSGSKTYRKVFFRTGLNKAEPQRRKNPSGSGDESRLTTESRADIKTKGGQVAPRADRKSRGKVIPAWSIDEFPVDPLPGKSRFHDFDIDLAIMRGIATLDFRYCTPIQESALPIVLNGGDLIGRAQTGTGKTAVFLIAIFNRLLRKDRPQSSPGRPRALIIAPTRELVVQIVKDGKELGAFAPLHIEAVYGGSEMQRQQQRLSSRQVDVIAATPGRLLDYLRRDVITLEDCSILVLDEADRMLDMGFIPDVRRIVGQMPDKQHRQTMLFSATISDDVRRLANSWCTSPIYQEAGEETVSIESIDQRVYLTTEKEKFKLLYNLVQLAEGGRVLVFENMKIDAARLAKKLTEHGLDCLLLTGDVPQNKRTSRLESFRSGRQRLLVATDVAGRGIHIDDIAYVVNYTLPEEPENYVHRIGRTGRAGAKGVAVSFACEQGSFNIPAIEEYIGRPLSCLSPEEDLLGPLPEPATQDRPAAKTGTGKPRKRRPRYRPAAKRHKTSS